MRRHESTRTARTASGVTFDPTTGEILDGDVLRLAVLPTRRRTVARRRWQHRLVALAPLILMLLAILFLAIWLHQPPPHCEPYMNC